MSKIITDFFYRTIHPVVLAEYIQYFDVQASQSDPLMGWLLASGVILVTFLNIIIYHHCCMGCQRIGMRVRIACCSLVYRKVCIKITLLQRFEYLYSIHKQDSVFLMIKLLLNR